MCLPTIGAADRRGDSSGGLPQPRKLAVNVFYARREPKSFGVDNWFDGRVTDLPVLMVDDVAASAPFMLQAAARVQQKLKLPLHHQYFCVVNKVGRGVHKNAQHTENYLDGQLVALFTLEQLLA